jgi:hypothetical protein
LTEALRASGVLRPSSRVRSFVAERLKGGIIGETHRLTLQLDGAAGTAPRMIAKRIGSERPTHVRTRDLFNDFRRLRFAEVEAKFYREIAPRLPVRFPAVYHCAFDESTGTTFLLLEDLGPLSATRDRLSVEDFCQLARDLAALHAFSWSHAAGAGFDWIPDRRLNLAGRLAEQYGSQQVRANLAIMPHPYKDIFETVVSDPVLGTILERRRQAIVFYDVSRRNLIPLSLEPRRTIAWIDPQFISRGSHADDLHKLLHLSDSDEFYRRARDLVVRSYRDALIAHDADAGLVERLEDDLMLAVLGYAADLLDFCATLIVRYRRLGQPLGFLGRLWVWAWWRRGRFLAHGARTSRRLEKEEIVRALHWWSEHRAHFAERL